MSKAPLYDEATGIHRAKTWEIALYALNNASTNIYVMCFMYVAYFLTGFVGVTVVVAGTITTVMRMWDGVTDPFIGYIIDKTNTKFGKNRPFIIIGNIILFIFSGLIFNLIPEIPESIRFVVYIVLYMFYIIGYTCQCVVTKSAQSCLTNDPKQRPVFSMFDAAFVTIIFAILPVYITGTLMPKYGGAEAFATKGFYVDLWLLCGVLSFIFACLAVFALRRKDREEFYGTGVVVKVGFKDYWDVLKNNKAIQMLVISASSDKLTSSMMSNAVIMVMIFGIIVGDYNQYGLMSAVIAIPGVIVTILSISIFAVRLGQKKAMLYGSWIGIIGSLAMLTLFLLGDPTTLDFSFTGGITFFTAAFIALRLLTTAGQGVAGNIVIPMTADCADYEVYRSGKYVPGLMGTLFSFIDKMISSLAGTFVALLVASIGFTTANPTQDDPLTSGIFFVAMFCYIGCPIIGWLCNVIAMKFYPLTQEKMAEIQAKIAEIKAENKASKATN